MSFHFLNEESQLQELPPILWVHGFRFVLPEESYVSGAWGMGVTTSGGVAPRWKGLVLLVFTVFKTEDEFFTGILKWIFFGK